MKKLLDLAAVALLSAVAAGCSSCCGSLFHREREPACTTCNSFSSGCGSCSSGYNSCESGGCSSCESGNCGTPSYEPGIMTVPSGTMTVPNGAIPPQTVLPGPASTTFMPRR